MDSMTYAEAQQAEQRHQMDTAQYPEPSGVYPGATSPFLAPAWPVDEETTA